MKKLWFVLKSFAHVKVFLRFLFIHFIQMQVKKKFPRLCTQFLAELIQLFITIAVAFRFCERVRIILANKKK